MWVFHHKKSENLVFHIPIFKKCLEMGVLWVIHIFTLWKTCGKLFPKFENVDNYPFPLLLHRTSIFQK